MVRAKEQPIGESIIISIRPKWAQKIFAGAKTVEVRKNAPKLNLPFKCYVYCTKGDPNDPWQRLEMHDYKSGKINLCNGYIMGEIIIGSITEAHAWDSIEAMSERSLVPASDLYHYAGGKKLYGWEIAEYTPYGKPKSLSEFGLTRPPRSWAYI